MGASNRRSKYWFSNKTDALTCVLVQGLHSLITFVSISFPVLMINHMFVVQLPYSSLTPLQAAVGVVQKVCGVSDSPLSSYMCV